MKRLFFSVFFLFVGFPQVSLGETAAEWGTSVACWDPNSWICAEAKKTQAERVSQEQAAARNAENARLTRLKAENDAASNALRMRASAGELPWGLYIDFPGIRTCAWASPAQAGIVTAGALATVLTMGGSMYGAGALLGTSGVLIAGLPVAGVVAGAGATAALGGGIAGTVELTKAFAKLTMYLTCTVDTGNGLKTSSIMTSLDDKSGCSGDIIINGNYELRCTQWQGVVPSDMVGKIGQ